MTKDKLLKEFKELQEAYDGLWHMKERYKKLWKDSDHKLVCIRADLKQFIEGIQ